MDKEKKPNNPNAFPNTDPAYFGADDSHGMTLRDYFANSAMQAMIANPQIKRPDESEIDFEIFSKRAYRYADAMLKQR